MPTNSPRLRALLMEKQRLLSRLAEIDAEIRAEKYEYMLQSGRWGMREEMLRKELAI